MIYYHSSLDPDLQLDEGKPSRYGFPAFFGSSQAWLAEQYHPHLFQFQVNYIPHAYDFRYGNSHSREFRNLMHVLKRQFTRCALIHRVVDYPDKSKSHTNPGTILVVFDTNIITDLEPAILVE